MSKNLLKSLQCLNEPNAQLHGRIALHFGCEVAPFTSSIDSVLTLFDNEQLGIFALAYVGHNIYEFEDEPSKIDVIKELLCEAYVLREHNRAN